MKKEAESIYLQGVLEQFVAPRVGLKGIVEVGNGIKGITSMESVVSDGVLFRRSGDLPVDHVHLNEQATINEDAGEDLDVLLHCLNVLSSWFLLFFGVH